MIESMNTNSELVFLCWRSSLDQVKSDLNSTNALFQNFVTELMKQGYIIKQQTNVDRAITYTLEKTRS